MKLINISGRSGVGKTTIAKLLKHVLNTTDKTVLHLSGDDLHKWERHDENWKRFTHLNPVANDIRSGTNQIKQLVNGNSIVRDIYNHKTGKFIKKCLIEPHDIIINEGLHGLYDKEVCELADLNIFVNTDDDLTRDWKLSRDVQSRGYKRSQVLKTIKDREHDEKKYIQPQMENADVIINFSRQEYSSIEMKIYSLFLSPPKLMEDLQKFYDTHKEFLMTCRALSFEYDLIQGAGGNMSYKFDDKIIITSSGSTMSDITMLNGYSVCDLEGEKLDDHLGRPSMEINLHTTIKNPIVLHTHPIYLNTILSSKDGYEIMKQILNGDDHFGYIGYTTPGKELAKVLRHLEDNEHEIVFLENHGLVCSGDTFKHVLDTSLGINQLCKDWLIRNAKTFTNYTTIKSDKNNKFLFPDAAVLKEENKSLNNYMLHIQNEVGLEPNFLTQYEVKKLKNMEEEKYRRSVV